MTTRLSFAFIEFIKIDILFWFAQICTLERSHIPYPKYNSVSDHPSKEIKVDKCPLTVLSPSKTNLLFISLKYNSSKCKWFSTEMLKHHCSLWKITEHRAAIWRKPPVQLKVTVNVKLLPYRSCFTYPCAKYGHWPIHCSTLIDS